jgi:hypothetical protein
MNDAGSREPSLTLPLQGRGLLGASGKAEYE